MRWEIERYVKLYRRDTAEWSLVPWRARGLFSEVLRKADLDGTIEVGRLQPAEAVAVLVHAERSDTPEIAKLLELLFANKCIVDVPARGSHGRHLVIPNYREAQGEPLSNAERQARHRAKAREKSPQVTKSNGGNESNAPSDPSIRADPYHPIHPIPAREAREKPDGETASNGEHDPLVALRLQIIEQLELPRTALRMVNGSTAERMRAEVERLSLKVAVEYCVERVREGNGEPHTLDYFLPVLEQADDPAPARAPGENPRPGDPDFNDVAAWQSWQAWHDRDDGRPHPPMPPPPPGSDWRPL